MNCPILSIAGLPSALRRNHADLFPQAQSPMVRPCGIHGCGAGDGWCTGVLHVDAGRRRVPPDLRLLQGIAIGSAD
jgi:hypothetical protein